MSRIRMTVVTTEEEQLIFRHEKPIAYDRNGQKRLNINTRCSLRIPSSQSSPRAFSFSEDRPWEAMLTANIRNLNKKKTLSKSRLPLQQYWIDLRRILNLLCTFVYLNTQNSWSLIQYFIAFKLQPEKKFSASMLQPVSFHPEKNISCFITASCDVTLD